MSDDEDDRVILGAERSDGTHPFMRSDGTYGYVRPIKEGEDIRNIETWQLNYDERSRDYKVTTITKGPARVTTPEYRESYDRIFGGRGQVAQA